MPTNWEAFKSMSVDEPITSSPWESKSTGSKASFAAPIPVPPTVISNANDDVASIISGLSQPNANLFGKANSVFAAPTLNSHNISNLDEAVISDSGSDLFNPNGFRDALSAISAPVAAQQAQKSRFASNLFGSASVAGVGVSSFNTGSHNIGSTNFLERFASVTEKTRELESGLGKLNLNKSSSSNLQALQNSATGTDLVGSSRRSSMFNTVKPDLSSPQAPFRDSRKQSFSEKLESYISNNGSPENSRHLSFSSDVTGAPLGNSHSSEHGSIILDNPAESTKNIWNPAAAPVFHPSFDNQSSTSANIMDNGVMQMPPQTGDMNMDMNLFMQHMAMMSQYGMPPGNFFQMPQMMSQFMPPPPPPTSGVGAGAPVTPNDEEKSQSDSTGDDENKAAASSPPVNPFYQPGLLNRPPPFMMSPFGPYGMFQPPGSMPGSPVAAPIPHGGIGPVGNNRQRSPPSRSPKPSSSGGPPNKGGLKKNGTSSPKSMKPKKHIVRSPLLEEFRSEKNDKEYTLKDIYGHGYEFAKDQHGSRFIQQQLEVANDQEKEVIFNEIRNFSIDLMTDVFGNYVIQKYFEHGNSIQQKVLFESMRGQFNSMSFQMYGCRVVQKGLEALPLVEQLEIMEELRDNIPSLVKDQNGNHVVQKAIECIPIDQVPFILDSIKHQIYHLSTHPYGCRVIQRLLEFSDEADQKFILDELKNFIYYLIQDQFGNYVIQHITEHGGVEYKEDVLNVVLENLVDLSKHKFASNAVEKCIIYQTKENRIKIYDEVMKGNTGGANEPLDETTSLSLMMKDPFANYVVQKLVELTENKEMKKALVLKIRAYLKLITSNEKSGVPGYGSKHLASIDKLIALSESIQV